MMRMSYSVCLSHTASLFTHNAVYLTARDRTEEGGNQDQ